MLALGGAHLGFVQPEVVGHLVPHGGLDQLFEVLGTAGQPLMRSLEDNNAVGHCKGFKDAAACDEAVEFGRAHLLLF